MAPFLRDIEVARMKYKPLIRCSVCRSDTRHEFSHRQEVREDEGPVVDFWYKCCRCMTLRRWGQELLSKGEGDGAT